MIIKRLTATAALCSFSVLASCMAPGTEERADTFQSGQLNQQQDVKIVTILDVSPTRVMVDNTRNKRAAQVAGGLLGAGLGVGLGLGAAHSGTVATYGGLGGGVAGALAGSAVPNKTSVNGVAITYKDGNTTHNSTQVGRLCEFALGQAKLIASYQTETRIQPNHQCPAASK